MTAVDDETIAKFLDIQVPTSISLSADGKVLAYATGYDRSGLARDTEHRVSIIWHAETGKAGSAKQLTSGLYNDRLPAISPDGKTVAFVSDRAKKGESCAIYSMSLSGGEPIPVTHKDNEQSIDAIKWSPDSQYVAYLSAEEKSSERKEKDKKKDDVVVFGKDLFPARLRIVNVADKTVQTVSNLEEHITELDWSYDGDNLAFLTSKRPDTESEFCDKCSIYTVSKSGNDQKLRAIYPTWIHQLAYTVDTLYFCGSVDQESVVSSFALYKLDIKTEGAHYQRIANGETDCCENAKSVGKDVATQVQNGLYDEIRLDGGQTLVKLPAKIMSWAAAYTKDSDEVILALAKGDINHPAEVYSKTASGGALVKLSNHAAGFEVIATTKFFDCKTTDGKERMENIFYTPLNNKGENGIPSKPMPTMLWVHGGPYSRLTDTNNPGSFYFVNLALKLGFAVMMPNYRGGSGRGEGFANKARGLMGAYDEPDVVAATQYCIEQGWIDKENVIVAGWSQGGHLSYLCSVRNGMHGFGWKYKAAIPGAGVTDWDTMSFTSDVGWVQAAFAGVPAWTTAKENVQNRYGSAIWEFKKAVDAKAIPPMLILHGEKDERVPLEQARAFRRGLDHFNLPYEMAIYPREGHTIKERYHVEDMLRRFTAFLQKHLR